jgi:hypothetical protein
MAALHLSEIDGGIAPRIPTFSRCLPEDQRRWSLRSKMTNDESGKQAKIASTSELAVGRLGSSSPAIDSGPRSLGAVRFLF